jgi:hypothetical protein
MAISCLSLAGVDPAEPLERCTTPFAERAMGLAAWVKLSADLFVKVIAADPPVKIG